MKFNLMSLGDLVTDPVTGERSTNARRYKMFPEMAVLAESAGFNGINMGEHHGIEYIYSAPPVVLAAIAERTTTLRLGTAVTLLANLDGLRIAEDYATVDVLSDGRVDVVHGRGNFFASTYTLFGQSLDESAARFKENAELVDKLWTGEPCTGPAGSGPRSTASPCSRLRSSPPATACGSAAAAPWSPWNSPPASDGS